MRYSEICAIIKDKYKASYQEISGCIGISTKTLSLRIKYNLPIETKEYNMLISRYPEIGIETVLLGTKTNIKELQDIAMQFMTAQIIHFGLDVKAKMKAKAFIPVAFELAEEFISYSRNAYFNGTNIFTELKEIK